MEGLIMSHRVVEPTVEDLEEEFYDIVRNMSESDVDAIMKGLPVDYPDGSGKVVLARKVWNKIAELEKNK